MTRKVQAPVSTIDELRERLGDDEFVRRLQNAMDELPDQPPFTRRERLRFWVGDVWWEFRQALHATRRYP